VALKPTDRLGRKQPNDDHFRSRFSPRVSANCFGGSRDRRVPGKTAGASEERRGGSIALWRRWCERWLQRQFSPRAKWRAPPSACGIVLRNCLTPPTLSETRLYVNKCRPSPAYRVLRRAASDRSALVIGIIATDSGRPRLPTSNLQPWFAIISGVQRALVDVAVGAFLFVSGSAIDGFVTGQYLPRISLMLVGPQWPWRLGLLVFQILTDIQRRYQTMLISCGG